MDTAADRAAAGVRALIASGRYGPGRRLPAERELALQLGLSRPALREGLRRLRSGGLLESRRGSGTYVVEADLDDIFELRVRLEPLAARHSASRRSDGELATMRRLIEWMDDHIADRARFAAHEAKVHALVADSSRQPILLLTLQRIAEMTSLARSSTAPDIARRLESLKGIERVVDAIERGEGEQAASAMERHLASLWDGLAAAGRDDEPLRPVASSA